MFTGNAILFNHESERWGESFVTCKITRAVAAIAAGKQEFPYLGNLDAMRDWGFAGDYIEGMWRMLQHDTPDNYVFAMDEAHSVREFRELTFGNMGLDWKKYVRTDERYPSPSKIDYLLGDPTKAKTQLSWKPALSFEDLVAAHMVDTDCAAIQ